jgi:transposase
MVSDFTSWRSLRKSVNYKNGALIKNRENIKTDNHFKTIHSKHIEWSKKGVYEKAFKVISGKNITNAKGNTLNLIIDATNIINKGGVDCIGYGSETRKKKFTKLTVVSNNTKIIAVHYHDVNDKVIGHRGKEETINTLEHDVKGIIPVVEKIQTNKKIILAGDKGYIVNDVTKKHLMDSKKVKLITPYRKNQKKTNTSKEKKILKTRNYVEIAINKIKAYSRIHVRRDKNIVNYMGFVYLALVHIT